MQKMKQSTEFGKGMIAIVVATIIGASTAILLDSVITQTGTALMVLRQDHVNKVLLES
ncbi:hypothetical protein PMIT1320_01806 [Prochlorococcus marinus str. MIT 1320]|nr:hypothetical protein PMIT1320_01806 [Prochlorococcus marinus str. MIT 1320]